MEASNAKQKILDALKDIEFHDLPVEKFSFKTEMSTAFIVDIALNNEAINDYEYWSISFEDIVTLKCGPLELNESSDAEITRFAYSWDELFIGKMEFLMGFGETYLAVEFSCKNVTIQPIPNPNEDR